MSVQDRKKCEKFAAVENARLENAGPILQTLFIILSIQVSEIELSHLHDLKISYIYTVGPSYGQSCTISGDRRSKQRCLPDVKAD